MKKLISALKEKNFSQGYYSQSYQDILIDEVFENIGTENSPPFCAEFGFNSPSLAGGTGTNVANLVLNKKWNYLLLDGENENPNINLRSRLYRSLAISCITQRVSGYAFFCRV